MLAASSTLSVGRPGTSPRSDPVALGPIRRVSYRRPTNHDGEQGRDDQFEDPVTAGLQPQHSEGDHSCQNRRSEQREAEQQVEPQGGAHGIRRHPWPWP